MGKRKKKKHKILKTELQNKINSKLKSPKTVVKYQGKQKQQ